MSQARTPIQLARVTRAARSVSRSRKRYRDTLQEAREFGYSFGDIARAAGVSRQAVRQLLADMESEEK